MEDFSDNFTRFEESGDLIEPPLHTHRLQNDSESAGWSAICKKEKGRIKKSAFDHKIELFASTADLPTPPAPTTTSLYSVIPLIHFYYRQVLEIKTSG